MQNVFRFIDDLNAMNDSNIFFDNIEHIYPPELELKKENLNESEASFLDLHIKIENNEFHTCLFDKRDDFNFDIVRMPFKSSNIPSNMFYNTIAAECLRIAKVSENRQSFVLSVKPLMTRMIKQGARKQNILNTLKKSFNKHIYLYSKIAPTFNIFSNLIFK